MNDNRYFESVPKADSSDNETFRDVIGNKTDAGLLAANIASLVAICRFGAKNAWIAKHHAHSGERWFGLADTVDGELHVADRMGIGGQAAETEPLVVDAGDDDWGTWTQILGSSDTPCDGGSATHFDFHRMRIAGAEDVAQQYMVEIALQEDAPADHPTDSDCYTSFDLISAGVGALATIAPFEIQAERVPATTKVWMRTRAPNKNTSTLDFFIGIHEYTDPDT